MSLTIVTHTLNEEWSNLPRTIASIKPALSEEIKHVVLDGHGQFGAKRAEAMKLDEYVAFVDDDDIVVPEALSICLQALKSTGAGLAVTDELVVSHDDYTSKNWPKTEKSYQALRSSPRGFHHLCVFRTTAVDPAALRFHNIFNNVGIDWFLKASAALVHGAVYVPMIGYHWSVGRKHARSSQTGNTYRSNGGEMKRAIAQRWGTRNDPLAIFPPPTA